MKKKDVVANDLKVARLKAGLRQIDCAHLLGHPNDARISEIENGHAVPRALEVMTLSIVYAKPMESLLSGLIDEVVDNLIERLRTVPPVRRSLLGTFNRTHTLSVLAKRLEVLATAGNDRS